MRGYIGRKELQKWWEHVLSCYVKTCNTRSKAVHLWKKVTGSISWRNYFKTKNVWTFLALLCSLFLEKRLEMLSDEKIEKCNSFLVSLFIFCFLNIIIRAFFRDINCTLTFPIARPTHFFRKEKKIPDSLVKEASTLLYKHTILF